MIKVAVQMVNESMMSPVEKKNSPQGNVGKYAIELIG